MSIFGLYVETLKCPFRSCTKVYFIVLWYIHSLPWLLDQDVSLSSQDCYFFTVSWHFTMYHGTITIYHGICHYTMVFTIDHGKSLCTMVNKNVPWYNTMYHGEIMMYHGTIRMYHVTFNLSWYNHNVPW